MEVDGGVRTGCIRIRCSATQKIMPRWFTSHRKKSKGRKTVMADCELRIREVAEIGNFSENGREAGEPSVTPLEMIDSELSRRDVLIHMGVSSCLLHLITACKEELHKMGYLRNELDKFLKSYNKELRREHKAFLSKPREQNEASAYSSTLDFSCPESSSAHQFSPQINPTYTSVGNEGSLRHYAFDQEEEFGGSMDQLEAELEAKLEFLQIDQALESKCSTNLRQGELKEAAKKIRESESFCFGDISPRFREEEHEKGEGPCPHELERKLHELLENRQEEQIRELEAALELTKHRLHLKESEVSWWKDTAHIVSKRPKS